MWTNTHDLEVFFTTVLCTTAMIKVFFKTPWPLFLWDSTHESFWYPGDWFNAFSDLETQNHFLFPRRVLEHLAVECSQEGAWEIAHTAKHKRDHDASAQGWELSLWGRLLDSGLHPGKKVIYLTRAMTGNQDSLPELSPLIVSLERHDPTCVLFF